MMIVLFPVGVRWLTVFLRPGSVMQMTDVDEARQAQVSNASPHYTALLAIFLSPHVSAIDIDDLFQKSPTVEGSLPPSLTSLDVKLSSEALDILNKLSTAQKLSIDEVLERLVLDRCSTGSSEPASNVRECRIH